ncbi:hypothetical protein RPMA_08930 [Tardiphaga alba]|uniref:Uncharacterized protein n=1 Tax=Tardiphaga alba TaxID=340268 RepID=A0ABX8A5G1_9BRAD|nr:hypothetical protein [Tardiphaga alba]QUS38934.1 hypothetical protein RPMA_08930 [Tardiphaga alba]
MMLAAGFALCGCVRAPFVTEQGETRASEWWIPHQIDRVTGLELPSAFVYAEASNSNYLYPRVSSLLLTCLEGKQPLVRFAFDFRIGTNHNTSLGYRFDDLPGHEDVTMRVLRNSRIVVIEDRDVIARFIAELEKSAMLHVRVRSIDGGRTVVDYPVYGAWAAIRAAFVRCDMPAPARLDPGRAKLPGIY